MSVGVHHWLIEQAICYLGKGKVAIHNIPDGFTKLNSDDIGKLAKRNYLFQVSLPLVHQLGQVEQVFAVAESFFDFHFLQSNELAGFYTSAIDGFHQG